MSSPAGPTGPTGQTVPEIVGSTLALATQTRGADVDRRAGGPRSWEADLVGLRRAGFAAIDLVDGWLPYPDLTDAELGDLRRVLRELDLPARGMSVTRISLIDPERGPAHLERTLHAVDVAAALGVPVLEIGFHPRLPDRPGPGWFWETPLPADDRSEATWELAVDRVRAVCRRAAEVGVSVNVELYEDTLVGTGSDAARLVQAVGSDNLGVNPDLGNVYRSATALAEPWLETLRGCVPHMTYWHLKNYVRSTAADGSPVAVHPTTLGEGDIDYRLALDEVLDGGYAGPLVVEHYGGDALWMQERGRLYLERLLADRASAAPDADASGVATP